ncbi:MAG: glutamate racemase [uncultured bacterium]|uniref:Glutamate racemase n=1 Tax=Candidatus Daviesbacteria bacterium GW2011_GWC2_40_12 TaxID=1618431 RepID=A0A0G0QLK8_9BACT|nr:MAG: glutamate racemase [uncultured bacterium]KKQ83331.1 MAG: Glutamate racemase [Candidatus Daviesbacteria bacterium GW2011_GWF2_38_7]KKR15813.1 MAG: Glutamate racemase [Candidatus Daviesbacteria bacterium GW2011_GWA2_39_33]KKR24605.1 MAG: Glutamate racemase [Candidatus Daviesbacteria bacterium GW2011_GWB1_39_5]KKR41314.1 MAG: Glutamate racemase [Candidatus Daviesbacteria bacterium GW2011_GWC2_40_12]OGE20996.1 MAG: glutamate racemase [Candidatus Daviesbacteria bacterium RIFCSPHIGHO2_01_FUL
MKNRPIGIFDSGIGGLTVAKEIIRLLPHESIIYIGDTARVPYGTRSNEIIAKFGIQLTDFLLKRNVKCLVVACNTISAVALEEIEKISKVPVLGVIKPAVSEALNTTKNKKIGVIGTYATINSRAYEKEIKKQNPDVEICSTGCPLFVPLAEEGFSDHPAAGLVAKDYLGSVKSSGADTLILGCTHYPILSGIVKKIMGPEVSLIDSAGPTAKQLQELLKARNLLADNRDPSYEFFVTDAPKRVLQVAGRFFGDTINGRLKKVSLD